jgi:hypothetical protein
MSTLTLATVLPNFDTSRLASSILENTLGHKLDEEMAASNLKCMPDGSDSRSNLRVFIDALLHRYPPPHTEEIQDEDNLPSQNVMDSAVNAEDWTFAGLHYNFGDITAPLTVPISSTVDTGVLNLITGVTWDTEDQDLVENHDQQGSDGENEVDEGNEGDMVDIIENEAEDDSSYDHSWESHKPPSLDEAHKALADLNRLIKPLHASGHGYKECLLPLKLHTCLNGWLVSFMSMSQMIPSTGKVQMAHIGWPPLFLQFTRNRKHQNMLKSSKNGRKLVFTTKMLSLFPPLARKPNHESWMKT